MFKSILKGKGLIRIALVLTAIFFATKWLHQKGYLDFDKTPPKITFSGNKNFYNMSSPINDIILQDKSGISQYTVFFASADTANKFIQIEKNSKKTTTFLTTINLNKTKLNSLFSTRISHFYLKIIAADNTFAKNTSSKTLSFALDSTPPTLKIVKKSLQATNYGSLLSFEVVANDASSAISHFSLNGDNLFFVKKKEANNYLIIRPILHSDILKKSITIKVFDKSGNSKIMETFFLISQNKPRKNIIQLDTMAINHYKNIFKTTTLVSFNKDVYDSLSTDIAKISSNIKSASKSANTSVKFENLSPLNGITKNHTYKFPATFLFSNKTITTNADFYKIVPNENITAIQQGIVSNIIRTKLLGNVIIIRHQNRLTSCYGLISETSVKIGDKITTNTPLGKPEFNSIFQSNFFFSLFLDDVSINHSELLTL